MDPKEFQMFVNGWDALLLQLRDKLSSSQLDHLTNPRTIEAASKTFRRK